MKRVPILLTLLPVLLLLAGCKSYRIDVRVENRTGAAVKLLEVDYPSASFGIDSLENGATLPYRLEVRGSGAMKVLYTDADGRTSHQVGGPNLQERQQGAVEIVLLPGGHAEFHPQLTQAN